MDQAAQILEVAHHVYARADDAADLHATRPPSYKIIGILLAVGSGFFIGTSFVVKKMGLLKANEKYNEVAGEGYGYLKNAWWWAGMILMLIGELLNFAAYMFVDAILVTPLGALSVVVATVGSAIVLKERLSMIGKVSCFLCIVGSVVIVLNAPQESAVANIQQFQQFVVTPSFLSYAGVIVLGAVIAAWYAGPRWGNKNMLVYISICSWIGGLSVVSTQGLGSAIVAQAGGEAQFKGWFIYIVIIFFIASLLTELIYLNKALNLFNAAMVTPTYYVYFTSTTIITSAVLFKGFKGTAVSIVTVVFGFLTICSGVVLLQLSKSAKDVPDAAVLSGDLDQIRTVAEQEQPETEPKADALRGAAAIVRRLSSAKQQKMEMEELKRLHEEKMREALETVGEDGPVYEWDGLRRRKTVLGSNSASQRSRAATSATFQLPMPTPHPPLGWSHFPTEEELAAAARPASPALSSIVGTIRNRARSVLLPGHPNFRPTSASNKVQSPMHPVQLTEIAVPAQDFDEETGYYPPGSAAGPSSKGYMYDRPGSRGSISSSARRVQFSTDANHPSSSTLAAPLAPPPLRTPTGATRQFSFQSVFKRGDRRSQHTHTQSDGANSHKSSHSSDKQDRDKLTTHRGLSTPHIRRGASEEETLGLVRGDSRDFRTTPRTSKHYDDDDGDDGSEEFEEVGRYMDEKQSRYGPSITHSPPRAPGVTGVRGGTEQQYPGGEEEDVKKEYTEHMESGGQGQSQGQGQQHRSSRSDINSYRERLRRIREHERHSDNNGSGSGPSSPSKSSSNRGDGGGFI
ncbi:hypothetical protein GE21DRAFT_6053 [Neurospora crassa]|uniref:DUF803 domain membrane protein n=2 Tax=Neurospora crassa TaxID=5141 RepID=Q7RYF0_NEUCR|nr:DUF803 domain membrane protein [Neurospora crassa OR74A]EAA27790.3 DUF803 domain membrane protein [Neurospora crassa OR74A]KHE88612.1 hypothetical protein GE21DRAFT_6053 [Neurospora crassa]CAF05988.1 conserved hypothetical protein [Neurospora crassa]|eukprot:XP_957026.3 DUF803 domain membrane protein [Neurospora crassa OR74A]